MMTSSEVCGPRFPFSVHPQGAPCLAPSIPACFAILTREPRWVVWRYETTSPDKKPTKVPYCPADTSRKASSTDATTWTDLETALSVYTRATGYFNGIMLALTGFPLVAFDLDDCIINGGELLPFAQQLLAKCGDTYIELTPSGTGLRVIGTGDGPPIDNKYPVSDGMSCEIYRKPAGRFITVTGKRFNDAPDVLADLNALADTVKAELEAAKAKRAKQEKLKLNGGGKKRDMPPLGDIIRCAHFELWENDRSRGEYYVVNELIRLGRSDEDIVAIFSDANNGIAAHCLSRPERPRDYIMRTITKARAEAGGASVDGSPGDTGSEIARLAALSDVEYERERKTAAERLGVRAQILDRLVQAERERVLDESAGLAAGPDKSKKAADVLIELSASAEELFHAPDGMAYAAILVGDHLETWPIRSKGFRRWLAREFFTETSSAPNSDAIQSALNVIEARAHFDGAQRPVYIRVGAHDGRLYLDLADTKWRAIEITSTGWQIVDNPPIRFRRTAGMLPLPEPVRGGKIEDLRSFLNIKDGDAGDKDFVLTVSFTLAALRERGPYPVLDLAGEHGSAKSTFARVLRKLIDPNSAPLRALPREDRDLFIAANNAHLLVFDNVSKMPDWISDTLCRLATGGGFAARQLYSDGDEALFDAMRPIILNGIEDIIGRPDLADRAIFLNLQDISDEKRKPEKEFWEDFDAAHPCILGALLDGVAHGLRRLPDIHLNRTPRMADFATWATACETAYWQAGTFARAYEQNRDDAIGVVIEADLVATAIQMFMAVRTEWEGTATDLLGALKMEIGEDKARLKEWPSTPRSLSGRVRRQAATLRRVGIDITLDDKSPDRKRTRLIKLARKEGGGDRPQPSDRPNSQDFSDIGADGRADGPSDEPQPTVRTNETADGADDYADDSPEGPSADNPLKNKASDGADGADANFPAHTGTSDKAPPESQKAALELAREFAGWPAPEPDGKEAPNFAKVLAQDFDWSPFATDRRSRR